MGMVVYLLFVVFLATVVANQKITGGPSSNTDVKDSGAPSKYSLWETCMEQPLFYPKKMLMESVLQGNPKKLITAPRGFGKSFILTMLKRYGINSRPEFDKGFVQSVTKGELIPSKYNVLYINLFAHEIVTTQQKVYELLREKIHLCYLMHNYLVTSDKLDPREKDICEKWCSFRFTELTNHAVAIGLTHLSLFLYKHHRSLRVFLFVDEFDSIVMNALHSASNVEFKLILQFLNGQISKLVKDNYCVERAIITGESFLAGSELAAYNDMEVVRFLGEHPIASYYGFTDTEVDVLLTEYNMGNDTKGELRSWYGGYTNKRGVSVYSPFSVKQFLVQGVLKSYWHQKGHVHSLLRYFQISFVEESIKKMLRYECAPVSLVTRAAEDDLIVLKNFLENVPESASHQAVHDLFFTYLFDQGYISYARNDSSCIAIPNLEVEQEFAQTLKQHYMQKHNLNPYILKKCAKFITDTSSHDWNGDGYLKAILNTFSDSLEGLFSDYKALHSATISSEDDLAEVMFAMANCAPGVITKSKLNTEYLDGDCKLRKGSIDLYLFRGSFAIIIELDHSKSKSPNSKAALQRILDRHYYTVFDNRIYTPKKIDHYLFLGLSINNRAILSISSLLDSKNITEAVTVRKIQRSPQTSRRNYSRKRTFPSRRPILTTTPVYLTSNSTNSSQ